MRVHEELFERDWERGSEAIRRYARSWVHDTDDLDEVVAIVWSVAWEKRSTFRRHGDFAGWLVAITRTVCGRAKLRQQRERRTQLREELPSDALPEHLAVQRARAREDREDALLNIVVRLPPRQRATVIARYCFGYPVKKIAAMLGRSEETVKATLAQAKRNLRALTAAYHQGFEEH
jgi:RNA polymerase sigma factor (sigma-70 family)